MQNILPQQVIKKNENEKFLEVITEKYPIPITVLPEMLETFTIETFTISPNGKRIAHLNFFKTNDETTMNLLSKSKKMQDSNSLLSIPGTTMKNITTYIHLMQNWNSKPIRHPLCDSSVAVNQNEKIKGKPYDYAAVQGFWEVKQKRDFSMAMIAATLEIVF